MKKIVFYKCMHCGNVVVKLVNSSVPLFCCGEPMKELAANNTDAALEKHVPVLEENSKELVVKIGSVPHPMLPEHYIAFIVLETENGFQVRNLTPNDKPEASFIKPTEKVLRVYEYCNLHGLWVYEAKNT